MTNLRNLPLSDPWPSLRREAEQRTQSEPVLARIMDSAILRHENFSDALSHMLANELGNDQMSAEELRDTFGACLAKNIHIAASAQKDLTSIIERDPATTSLLAAFLYFKGYQSLQAYRMAHQLWRDGRTMLALSLQGRISKCFDVDIHPAARIGSGILMDHASGIVIGETAVIEDDVSILHGVTLGGTGKETGDRHPKVRSGVLIGAGAKILGNIEIGSGARIAAGSVVLDNVPPHVTVAGVPARIVGAAGCAKPATEMDQTLLNLEVKEKSA